MPTGERVLYRVEFEGEKIGERPRYRRHHARRKRIESIAVSFPAKHYVTPEDERARAMDDIKLELKEQLAKFERAGKVARSRAPQAPHQPRPRAHPRNRLLQRDRKLLAPLRRPQAGRAAVLRCLTTFPHKADGTPDFLTIIDEIACHRAANRRHVRGRPRAQGKSY